MMVVLAYSKARKEHKLSYKLQAVRLCIMSDHVTAARLWTLGQTLDLQWYGP